MADRMFGRYSDWAPRSIERDFYDDSSDEFEDHPSNFLLINTAKLVLHGHQIQTYTQKLHKLNESILRKRKKSKSKKLEDCEHDYDDNYGKLINAAEELLTLLKLEDSGRHIEGDHKHVYTDDALCSECETKQLGIWRHERSFDLQSKKDDKEIAAMLNSAEHKISKLEKQLSEELAAKDEAILRILKIEQQLSKALAEKDEAIIRSRIFEEQVNCLVKQMSELSASKDEEKRNKLAPSEPHHNNISIAELSDNNHPRRLAEKISQLYDTEWKDAFVEMETHTHYTERELINYLLSAFMDIFAECRRITTDMFFEKVQRCIEHSDQGLLKQSRFDYVRKSPYNLEKARTYLKKCAELSWIMCVQNPPLVLSTEAPKEFNTALFREYTKRGRYIAFVVWPILYLHDGGPILRKGVAQGENDNQIGKGRNDTLNRPRLDFRSDQSEFRSSTIVIDDPIFSESSFRNDDDGPPWLRLHQRPSKIQRRPNEDDASTYPWLKPYSNF